MKKRLWITVFVWMAVGNAAAGPVVGFGVKAGVDLAGQSWSQNAYAPTDLSHNNLFGFNGGVFGDLVFTDFLSVQTEAQFIQKGSSTTLDNFTVTSSGGTTLGTTTANLNYTYNYLEIPLLIKANMISSPGLKTYLMAGPALAFLLGETTTDTIQANGAVPYSQVNVDDTRFYPGTDWSLVMGGGVEYQNFLLEIRYELGLNSAAQNIISDRSFDQNNALCFQLGYRLL